jgi:hypothetical protein
MKTISKYFRSSENRTKIAVIDSWNLWHEERTFLGSAYAGDKNLSGIKIYLDNSSNDEYTKAEACTPKSY